MKNAPALIVIIIAVVAIMIAIGLVIANLTHKYAVDKAKELALEMEAKKEAQREESEYFPVYEEYFALQIMASNNYEKVDHLQDKLQKAGYQTKITKVKREGEILYRLRLEELYKEEKAIELGEKLKSNYPDISSYWLEERKTELVQKEEKKPIQEKAEKQEIKPIQPEPNLASTPEKYEIQLMATVDYDKIKRISSSLDAMGYPTKILVVKKGETNFYRLRIDGAFVEMEANNLGKEIVTKSPSISDFWLDEKLTGKGIATPVKTKKTESRQTFTRGEYKVQLLANPNRSFVEERKQLLEDQGYAAEITSAVVKGKKFYRLRTANAYTRNSAEKIGQEIKNKFDFIADFWVAKVKSEQSVVRKTPTEKAQTPTVKEKEKKTSTKKPSKVMVCNRDNVNIRIGPGDYYALDPIGKLMKGITVFVLEEKNGWMRFTISKDDESWSGWVNKKYLD